MWDVHSRWSVLIFRRIVVLRVFQVRDERCARLQWNAWNNISMRFSFQKLIWFDHYLFLPAPTGHCPLSIWRSRPSIVQSYRRTSTEYRSGSHWDARAQQPYGWWRASIELLAPLFREFARGSWPAPTHTFPSSLCWPHSRRLSSRDCISGSHQSVLGRIPCLYDSQCDSRWRQTRG